MTQRMWPLARDTFRIGSGFGDRPGGFHAGQDFEAADGTPFYACAGGTVLFIGPAQGYGQWIVIDHPAADGGGVTEYGHMWDAWVTGLSVGDRVEAGQLLGYVGNSGQSSGPHLHLSVMPHEYAPARKVDPLPWLAAAVYPGESREEAGVDTLFADVSYFQAPVDDSYPYRILSFRSNDGTFRDPNFAANYAWATAAADEGRLACFIVYFYWRPNWAETVRTHRDMVAGCGGPHPRMITMIDVESGGNPGGDQSEGINRAYWELADWLGDPRRVIGYANAGDLFGMWSDRPDGLRLIGAGYGRNPNLPGQIAHQYTDGGDFGGDLPQGCPPFGPCDMNVANGLSPAQVAAACGIGTGDDMAFLDETMTNWAGDEVPVRDVLRYVDRYNGLILDQLVGPGARERGGEPTRWEALGNRTVVEALAIIGETLGIAGFGIPGDKKDATVIAPSAIASAQSNLPGGSE